MTAMLLALLVSIAAAAQPPGAGDQLTYVVFVCENGADESLINITDDVLGADGYLLGTTANFGYMSGALKHFFDTIFLEAGGALADDGSAGSVTGGRKPYGLWVHGRYDTTGAVRGVEAITTGLQWKRARPASSVVGAPS